MTQRRNIIKTITMNHLVRYIMGLHSVTKYCTRKVGKFSSRIVSRFLTSLLLHFLFSMGSLTGKVIAQSNRLTNTVGSFESLKVRVLS